MNTAEIRVAVAVALLAAVFGAGWHFGGLGPKAELAELRADAAAAVSAEQAKARATETEWAARAAAVEANYEAKRQKLDVDLRRSRADSQRLRDTIAAYTDRPAAKAGTACSPDERASTLGELLAEADELAGESAAAADAEGERVRALQSWVKSTR